MVKLVLRVVRRRRTGQVRHVGLARQMRVTHETDGANGTVDQVGRGPLGRVVTPAKLARQRARSDDQVVRALERPANQTVDAFDRAFVNAALATTTRHCH